MWCPEGYYSWHQAFSDVQEIADEIAALVCMGGTPNSTVNGAPAIVHTGSFHLEQSNLVASEHEADLAIALFGAWLMAHFLEEFPPVAVGLGGNNISLHPLLLGHREQFELCMLTWPMTAAVEFSSLVEMFSHSERGFLKVFDRFNFLDVSTGLIRPKNGAREHLMHYESYDEVAANSIIDLATGLRNFSVCWAEKPTAAELRKFLTVIEIDERFTRAADFLFGKILEEDGSSEQSGSTSHRRGGRPSEHAKILEYFHQTYPDGLEGINISAVARRLGYDRKTVRTALLNAGLLPARSRLGTNHEQN